MGTGRPVAMTLLRPTRLAPVAIYGAEGLGGEGWVVGLTAAEESVVFGCPVTVNQVRLAPRVPHVCLSPWASPPGPLPLGFSPWASP